MSNTDDYYDDDDQQQPEPQPRPRELRQQIDALNAENARLKAEAERTADLERKVAFFEAGLPNDLNETRRKAIIATAPDTTPEGFRKAAEELGFVEPPAPAAPPADIAAHDRVAAVQGEGNFADPGSLYHQELAEARNEADALAVMRKFNVPIVTE